MRIILSLLLLGVSRAAVQCGDLVCYHNSQCVSGTPDFSDQPKKTDGSPLGIHIPDSTVDTYCQCSQFYTGIDCSIPVENCDDGQHKCYHGGVCYMKDSVSLPFCDCSGAIDLENGGQYVGKYCEQYTNEDDDNLDDTYCDHVDLNTFCLNGGTCNTKFPAEENNPCNCQAGFKGAHCEFEEDAVPDCTLDCMNGGLCRLGENPKPGNIGLHLGENPNDDMYCECPEGWDGPDCTHEVEACGGATCMNGSTCKAGIGGDYCDCTTGYDVANGIFYAGVHCQYEANEVCGAGVFNGQAYFCTNGGTCLSTTGPSGCNCPDGADGEHCEYVHEVDCTLDCLNGGVCKAGDDQDAPDYSLSGVIHHDKQYCECPDGFSGGFCEITPENRCGDGACLNGGRCETNFVAGEERSYCNCLPAYDEKRGVYFDGRYCQFASTTLCFDDTDTDEIYYCTNKGQCQREYLNGCLCPEGYGGFSCEFIDPQDCNLDCKNGGTCKLGSPPGTDKLNAYWFNPDDYMNWQYCECPNGFSGQLCEGTIEESCGDFVCLNGGKCNDEDGNPMDGRCNCLEAQNGDTYYDGLYCQFPSTDVCYKDDTVDEVYFCMNNGECQDDHLKGCICPEGYGGFSCELVEGVDCKLDCGDHGTCRLGAPPGSSYEHAYWYDPDAQADYEYCECDGGYNGKYCEVSGTDCGDFTCLNGGTCIGADGERMVDRCNCLGAFESGTPNTYYDGRFCQYPSTSVCFEGNDEAYFCMNDGTCNDDYYQGCTCPPGFSGFSCEFLEGTDCTLDCNGNGKCRLGSPPGGSHAHAYWYDPNAQENYQYCECDQGFGGKHCESMGEDCGEFTCLNGGRCTDDDGNPMYDRCNCLYAYDEATDTYYDGRFCQYGSTSVCYADDVDQYFCMNDGQCQTDYLQGCICPDGFSGFSCEFIQGTDCTLTCQNGGECRLGAPPGGSHEHAYWYDPDAQGDYEYCHCASGFGGKFCEFAGEDCGDFTCLNGGKCDGPDGEPMVDRCNCLDAYDEVNGEGTYYDGRFCQYGSTSICKEDEEEDLFCMNDGRCRSDVHEGCACQDGFAGFSCEFIQGTDCTLDCKNGGTCRLGEPPEDSYLHAYWYDPNAQQNYQYCECPDGLNGKYCESDAVDCGDFTCLNGGECKSDAGRPMNGRCNCINAFDDSTNPTTYFDGLFCQFESTSVCYEGEDQVYFCMNDGQCKDDPTAGCVCKGQYTGFYCELQNGQDCTLDCKNGGTCVLGSPPGISTNDAYWYNPEKEDEYQYCQCPEGFSGTQCESIGGELCGDNQCFNGGTCITRVIGDKEIHHCDCRDAGENGKFYAGTYCQYESTEICLEQDFSVFFCVNDGQCKTDYKDGCSCKEGTTGFSCEFVLNGDIDTSSSGSAPSGTIVDQGDDAVCDLDCNGHGTCRNGIKDINDLEDAANANHLSYTHDNFQHCVCDDGWTGVTCSYPVVQCGDDKDQFCLHGAQCFSENGEMKCDCSKAEHEIADKFAGSHCEHTADVCVTTTERGSPESFCANGGTCLSYSDRSGTTHPGCTCPVGFTGDRCEFTINKSPTKAMSEDGVHPSRKRSGGGGDMNGVAIAAIVLSVCAILAVGMFFVSGCLRRKRFRRREGETSGLIWAGKQGYKDHAETVNFSPHKGGYSDDYMASFANPSRDPMATALAPDTSEAVESDTSTGKPESDHDDPQIFIGPPTDEDGHILHSVDIL